MSLENRINNKKERLIIINERLANATDEDQKKRLKNRVKEVGKRIAELKAKLEAEAPVTPVTRDKPLKPVLRPKIK